MTHDNEQAPAQGVDKTNRSAAAQRDEAAATALEYLTPAQVAARTGFSIKALEVKRARKKGPVFSKPDGRNVRYRWQDVIAWLEAGEVRS